VQRRSLPKPFIQDWVRSTTQRWPACSGAGVPLRAIIPVSASPASVARVPALS